MRDVGIVGGGISGLHLGIRLLDVGETAAIYHPQTAAEIERGPMLNSVIHQHDTVRREQAMRIEFWNESNVRVGRGHDHCINIPGQSPIRFWGGFKNYGKGVDYRLMIPRLMAEFERRGGTLVHAAKTSDDLTDLQARHDLVAIGVGKTASGFTGVFDEVVELSPHERPARLLCCGLFDGVAANDPFGVTLSISPVSGELVVLPMESLGDATYALLFENLPGGPSAHLAELDRKDDPEKFITAVLSVVEEFHPATYARIDPAHFRLHDEMALLQGGFRPVVRRAYAMRGESTPLISIGDLRVTMDPVTGAGANLGSYGAWTLAEHISAHEGPFDLGFAERYEEAVAPRTTASVGFNNLVLAPPDYFIGLLMEMSTNRALCDEFTESFTDPEHLWFDMVKDAETAAAFAAAHR